MVDFVASQARERMKTARQRIFELNKQLTAALHEVRAFKDPNLSPEGLSSKREELRGKARATFEPKIDQLQAQIRNDADTAKRHLDETRPKVGNDPAGLMRMQMKWDQVRMRLEAGSNLQRIISNADQDTLLAIAEWAPTWLSTQDERARPAGVLGTLFADTDPSAILSAVDARLAEVAGSSYATAYESAREAASEAAYAKTMLSNLSTKFESGGLDPMVAAVSAHYDAQFAGAPPEASAEPGDGGAGSLEARAAG